MNLTAQSDQFSLRLVLYELAAGKRAFPRSSAAETMTAIIREDAEPLPSSVPAPFRWIVGRLLHKEPVERYDSTRDLYRELRQVRDRLSESTSTSAVAAVEVAVPQRSRRNWLGFALIAAIFAAAGMLGTLFFAPKPHNAANDRYTPIETSLESPEGPSWSPDGKAFTYSAIFEGKRQVFVRYLNATLSTRLTNLPSDAYALGWAPDGKRIFLAAANPVGGQPARALFSVSIAGGEPELLMPLDVTGAWLRAFPPTERFCWGSAGNLMEPFRLTFPRPWEALGSATLPRRSKRSRSRIELPSIFHPMERRLSIF